MDNGSDYAQVTSAINHDVGEELFDVKLEFTAEGAANLGDAGCPSVNIQRHANGTATMWWREATWDEIVSWILEWPGDVRIVDPPDLREKLIAQLRRVLDLHRA